MNEILLVYLWGIYEQIGVLVGLLISGMIIYTITAILFGAIMKNVPQGDKDRYKSGVKFQKSAKLPSIAVFILLILDALTPTRNVAIMMFSAPAIVKIAKQVEDSNTTKQIGNLLQNSLDYLEDKSKELKEK